MYHFSKNSDFTHFDISLNFYPAIHEKFTYLCIKNYSNDQLFWLKKYNIIFPDYLLLEKLFKLLNFIYRDANLKSKG